MHLALYTRSGAIEGNSSLILDLTTFDTFSFFLTDLNRKLIFLFQCNSMQLYDVYIPYSKFNNLTKEEAITYSQGHNIYKDNFQGHEVKRISFYVKKDYMAMIEYFIPSLDNKIIQKLHKMKKKMS